MPIYLVYFISSILEITPRMPNRITSTLGFTLVTVFALLMGALAVAQPPGAEVTIKDFKFIPPEVRIKVGETVKWTNTEKRQYHSVWFQQAGDPEPPYIFPDEFTQRTFEKAGSFPYRCGPHPEMTGIVHVE